MALASWPVPPANWVLPWAIWRFKGQPDPRPSGTPAKIPAYAWEFLQWAAWRRKGAKPPRPDVTPRIPQWGWNYLKQINIAVPLVPPPPPPPPPVTYTNSYSLPNPLMFTTWGWTSDSEFRDTDQALDWIVNIAKCRTIALQIGQFPANVPDRCRAYGLKIVLWGSPDAGDRAALVAAGADGYMPQIEGPYEYQRTRDNLAAGFGNEVEHVAIVTTLSGLDTFTTRPSGESTTVEAETLISYGCTHGWVECYKQGGPSHFPISKMAWSLEHRGMPFFSPLIGLYWDVDVDEYQPDVAQYGKRVGAYTAETMRPIDRVKFGALGT